MYEIEVDSDEENMDEIEVNSNQIPEDRSSIGTCGFMEYVVHHLLYVKNIFPKQLFKRSQRNGLPLWYCIQPDVMKYIWEFLEYANKCFMRLKEIDIIFVLIKRNCEILEEFHFELKSKDPCDDSDSKLVCEFDNLASICEDIQKRNTFTRVNATNSGLLEFNFELQFLTGFDDELPESDSVDRRWIRCAHINPLKMISVCTSIGDPWTRVSTSISEKNILVKIIPLTTQRFKKYEIKAYALKKFDLLLN